MRLAWAIVKSRFRIRVCILDRGLVVLKRPRTFRDRALVDKWYCRSTEEAQAKSNDDAKHTPFCFDVSRAGGVISRVCSKARVQICQQAGRSVAGPGSGPVSVPESESCLSERSVSVKSWAGKSHSSTPIQHDGAWEECSKGSFDRSSNALSNKAKIEVQAPA